MSDAKKPLPKEWNLLDMIEAVKAKAPTFDTATMLDLRSRARNRPLPKLPDVDSLKAALGRIVTAVEGKPIGPQHITHPSGRPGVKEYCALVAVRDVIAVGLFLESKNAHDARTRNSYDGALKSKWGEDGSPRYIQQLVGELVHMLQVAAMAGAGS